MTEYRAGQRVRIEWPDGAAIEDVLVARGREWPRYWTRRWHHAVDDHDGRTVTILAEPRPEEPTKPGAVVLATVHNERCVCNRDADGLWWPQRHARLGEWRNPPWEQMCDPEVIYEGWTP